jgi:Flp pilus assembly secretin CpaC
MTRPFSLIRRRPLAGLALAALCLAGIAGATAASAEPIAVIVDRAKVMRISRAADIVIIGNPAIADATIQDAQTLIITGRSFGSTNLIVLDADGLAIADETITVGPQNDQVVTVYRRASRETFSCTPDCSPTLALGDNTASFDSVTAQIQSHGSLSDAAAAK